jgi:hypothetical protein
VLQANRALHARDDYLTMLGDEPTAVAGHASADSELAKPVCCRSLVAMTDDKLTAACTFCTSRVIGDVANENCRICKIGTYRITVVR